MIGTRLANSAAFLGGPWRWTTAMMHALAPLRQSYSQKGEDILLWNAWKRLQPNATGGVYVDVGASHPARLSNTYLFYRRGWHGVTIDPNEDLMRLHRVFRPRDVQFSVACGAEAGVLPLRITAAPVLSTFLPVGDRVQGVRVLRTEYVPVLPLDEVLGPVPLEQIDILSIDAEGWDLHVLRGAQRTLKKTLLLVVEANTPAEEEAVRSELDGRFAFLQTVGCNLLFERRA